MDARTRPAALLPIARLVGIVAPTLYCGVTAACSYVFVQPIVEHAPNQKVLARQWLRGYQMGPYWVPYLVVPGVVSNAFLAAITKKSLRQALYTMAAIGVFSIIPMTAFWMEPGINGAAKWKVHSLLKDEGVTMPDTGIFKPSVRTQSATENSRTWAEKTDMKDLVLKWREVNNYRWILGGVAAVLSGCATIVQMP